MTSPVRVVNLITRMIVGGAQETALAGVAGLDPARFRASLWTGPQLGPEGSLLEEADRRGVDVRIFPDLVRQVSPMRDLRVTRQLAQALREEGVRILHTHSSKAGIVGRWAAGRAGTPRVVHTAHGWGFHDGQAAPVRALYRTLERRAARGTDVLVSVARKSTQVGLDAGIGRPSQYRLIRSGIPLDAFGPDPVRRESARRELGIAPDEVVIGSVGRLSAQKNPLDFVRLAARLCERGVPRVTFLYVGDGPLRPNVEAAESEAGLKGRIRWLGLRHDVPDLMRALDVFVLVSLWEGLPRVVPQALATGVPVVSYAVTGLDEILVEGRNGHLVPMRDVDAMARCVEALARDGERRLELARRCVDEFDHSFSEREMLHDLQALYDELVDPMAGGSATDPAVDPARL
jgi:glycosyltransferase involved in cell wall biosynthesis